MLIGESVSVNFVSSHKKKQAWPWVFEWRGRRYVVDTVGLHYTTREGKTLFHYYCVFSGDTSFKLRFDTETLGWNIVEVAN